MNIRTLILDDDENSRLAAKTALQGFPDVELVGSCQNSRELFSCLKEQEAHLLFLDIELEQEMGFEIAKALRRDWPKLLIVFLTGHSSYAIDGYDFQPVNFLTKPINEKKLAKTMEEVRRRLGEQKEQSSARLMFHLSQGYRILDVRDICYIERENRKNFLHTETETLRIMNYTMRELEEMLSQHGFFLSHQSFLMSLYRVETVRDAGRQLYEAVLKGCQKPVPVSRNRYEELIRQLRQLNLSVYG